MLMADVRPMLGQHLAEKKVSHLHRTRVEGRFDSETDVLRSGRFSANDWPSGGQRGAFYRRWA